MDNEPEMIRREMAETRASLTDKLEMLEDKVVDTVLDATSAVHDTVENVKDAVQETVTSVKDTVSDTVEGVRDVFNLSLQVDRHPCLMMGAAVAVGYIGGSLLSRFDRDHRPLPPVSAWPEQPQPAKSNWRAEERSAAPPASSPAPPKAKHAWTSVFGPELAKFKGLAIGYLMSAVRDAVSDALPKDMRSQLHETMDSITHKLGGQPVLGVAKESSSDSGQGAHGPEERTTNGPYMEARSRW
jgi:ElaB/YqjD/DUF883 family membrane-anchored ribosome-binding protein